MPAKICHICGTVIGHGPVAVLEISAIEAGRATLDRSILCPECAAWARTFARTRRVVQPGESTAIPPDPPLKSISR